MSVDKVTEPKKLPVQVKSSAGRITYIVLFMVFALILLLVFLLQITYQAQLWDLSKDLIVSL